MDWRKPVAIAVSGGGDSMVLLASVLQLRQQETLDTPVFVLTVDHDMRRESAGEAASVAGFCAQFGVTHSVLMWRGVKPSTAVAERGRMMRRDLLLAECRARGVRQLLLAHTMDDVCETLLMRVRRGGLRGHASIAPETEISGIQVLRPFLTLQRTDLRNALRRSGLFWFDDPSNANMQYERPRVRRALQDMVRDGFPLDRIAAYATVMGRWRAVIAQRIASVIATDCELVGADVHLRAGALRSIPRIIAVETLRELVRFVGGDAYMIAFDQANTTVHKLLNSDGDAKAFSSGRCVLTPCKNDVWRISRAERELPVVSVEAGQSVVWDGRFAVEVDEAAQCSVEIGQPIDKSVSDMPVVLPETVPHSINFRPRVLNGPIAAFDKPIFQALEGLLVGKIG
ncbi:MAG: tRNA lysidine(34) synthetase TilS [Hyphomicrobiales bacterium]